jgi:hypothetical protein
MVKLTMTKSTKHMLQFCACFTMMVGAGVPALVAGWLICPWFWPAPAEASEHPSRSARELTLDDFAVHTSVKSSDEGGAARLAPLGAALPAKTGGWTHAEKMLECDKLPTWFGVLACRFDQ